MMSSICFKPPDKMNLLGYFLRSLLERKSADPRCQAKMAKMRGVILVRASGMQVALKFSQEGLAIIAGEIPRPDARVAGSLDALLAVALGGPMLTMVVRRELRVGGKIWKLLPLLTLLRVPKAPAAKEPRT